MTDEQRMEEGRRMFQIFAARMFEQRVLTAYREKVALQRQQKLIEELMEEETRNEQRTAKKARDAQKKKDKKKLQRQATEEEKARKEAEKAMEEAALRAEQEKKLEETRKKREDQRKKKESEKKAQDEERARKEAEKQRRLREERERQAETERKAREARELKEQEKKNREEAKRKEKEERELREKELRDKKAREENEELAKQQRRNVPPPSAAAAAAGGHTKRVPSGPVTVPPQHPPLQSPRSFQMMSTPSPPKSASSVKAQQQLQQPVQKGSRTPSPPSQATSAAQSQFSASPRSAIFPPSGPPSGPTSAKCAGQPQMGFHNSHSSTPLSPLGVSGKPPGLPPLTGLPSQPPGIVPRHQPINHELPMYPPHQSSASVVNQYRGFHSPNGIPPAPTVTNGARPGPAAQWGLPLESGQSLPFNSQPQPQPQPQPQQQQQQQQPIPNAFHVQQKPPPPPQTHSRHTSSSFERSALDQSFSNISRPSPIRRPSSTAQQQDQRRESNRAVQDDLDELSTHLGSSALLDDNATPYPTNMAQPLPAAPGPFQGPSRGVIGGSSLFPVHMNSK